MLVRPTIAADSAHMRAKAFPAPASRLPSRLIVRIVVTLSHPVWMDASVLSIWEEIMKVKKEGKKKGKKKGRKEGRKERDGRKEGRKERRKNRGRGRRSVLGMTPRPMLTCGTSTVRPYRSSDRPFYSSITSLFFRPTSFLCSFSLAAVCSYLPLTCTQTAPAASAAALMPLMWARAMICSSKMNLVGRPDKE